MSLRYNLFYAYKKSKISKHVHSTAVNCVIVCLLLQQLFLMMFSITRSGKEEDGNSKFLSVRAVFSITVFAISIFLYVLQVKIFMDFCPMPFLTCASLSPLGILWLFLGHFAHPVWAPEIFIWKLLTSGGRNVKVNSSKISFGRILGYLCTT